MKMSLNTIRIEVSLAFIAAALLFTQEPVSATTYYWRSTQGNAYAVDEPARYPLDYNIISYNDETVAIEAWGSLGSLIQPIPSYVSQESLFLGNISYHFVVQLWMFPDVWQEQWNANFKPEIGDLFFSMTRISGERAWGQALCPYPVDGCLTGTIATSSSRELYGLLSWEFMFIDPYQFSLGMNGSLDSGLMFHEFRVISELEYLGSTCPTEIPEPATVWLVGMAVFRARMTRPRLRD